MQKISVILFLIFFIGCSKETKPDEVINTATSPNGANQIVVDMGTGFNLGNTFEIKAHSTDPKTIFPILDLYHNIGMKHVRIPVTWMDGFDGGTLSDIYGNLNITHPRFIQLEAVIDYAISKGYYVIINAHHENWLFKKYDGTALYDDAFHNLWFNIAKHFKNYSNKLIFELINEPHGVFGDWSGGADPNSEKAKFLTRRINSLGYNAIRWTGGFNTKRMVVLSTNGFGNHYQLKSIYPTQNELPGGGLDSFLSIGVHTYDPWEFCGHTGKNSAYTGKSGIINSLTATSTQASKLKVPIIYGEFGVGREKNVKERDSEIVREYYRTIRTTCLSQKMAPTVWDDRGWFGLISSTGPNTYTFQYNIVPNMLAP